MRDSGQCKLTYSSQNHCILQQKRGSDFHVSQILFLTVINKVMHIIHKIRSYCPNYAKPLYFIRIILTLCGLQEYLYKLPVKF